MRWVSESCCRDDVLTALSEHGGLEHGQPLPRASSDEGQDQLVDDLGRIRPCMRRDFGGCPDDSFEERQKAPSADEPIGSRSSSYVRSQRRVSTALDKLSYVS